MFESVGYHLDAISYPINTTSLMTRYPRRSPKTSTDNEAAYKSQCEAAAADAFARLVASGQATSGAGTRIPNYDFTEGGRRLAGGSGAVTSANAGSVGAQGGSLGGTWGEDMCRGEAQ